MGELQAMPNPMRPSAPIVAFARSPHHDQDPFLGLPPSLNRSKSNPDTTRHESAAAGPAETEAEKLTADRWQAPQFDFPLSPPLSLPA